LLEQVLGTRLKAPVYNEESGALLGARAITLSASEQSLP